MSARRRFRRVSFRGYRRGRRSRPCKLPGRRDRPPPALSRLALLSGICVAANSHDCALLTAAPRSRLAHRDLDGRPRPGLCRHRDRRPARRARLQRGDWQALGRMLLLTLPLWLIMAPIRPSQPDTFAYLLPNAVYLGDHGVLPTASSPPSASFLPASPYNGLFLTFLGSLFD